MVIYGSWYTLHKKTFKDCCLCLWIWTMSWQTIEIIKNKLKKRANKQNYSLRLWHIHVVPANNAFRAVETSQTQSLANINPLFEIYAFMLAYNMSWSCSTHSFIVGRALLSIRTHREAKSANIVMVSIEYELGAISGSITFFSFFLSLSIFLNWNPHAHRRKKKTFILFETLHKLMF